MELIFEIIFFLGGGGTQFFYANLLVALKQGCVMRTEFGRIWLCRG